MDIPRPADSVLSWRANDSRLDSQSYGCNHSHYDQKLLTLFELQADSYCGAIALLAVATRYLESSDLWTDQIDGLDMVRIFSCCIRDTLHPCRSHLHLWRRTIISCWTGAEGFQAVCPVIKLPEEASEDDHLALLGVLNSSTACFWLKQVSQNKGNEWNRWRHRQMSAWEPHTSSPEPSSKSSHFPTELPLEFGRELDSLAQQTSAAGAVGGLRR